MRILVTGAKGALGQDVTDVFTARGHEVIAVDRHELDITNRDQVQQVVHEKRPDIVINCAAYNLVDKCEEPEIYPIAYAINAEGPENLAVACKDSGSILVHLSTDFVFSGEKPEGYAENDLPRPISKYGQSKLAGEELIAKVGGKNFIVRTSKLFGRPARSPDAKESFVFLMLRLAASKPELAIVNEEVGCPTYTLDLAQGLHKLVVESYPPGIYHLVNSGSGVTWYEFAEEIFTLQGVTTPRKPVLSKDFPKPAARPKFAALLNTKFPSLRSRPEALREFLETV